MRSNDTFSWYQLGNDVIEIPQNIEQFGGSNDLNVRKGGLPNLYTEYRNAMLDKTGQAFRTVGLDETDGNITGTIMNQEKAGEYYAVKIGLKSKEQADEYLKHVYERLKSGAYFNGAKLNQS